MRSSQSKNSLFVFIPSPSTLRTSLPASCHRRSSQPCHTLLEEALRKEHSSLTPGEGASPSKPAPKGLPRTERTRSPEGGEPENRTGSGGQGPLSPLSLPLPHRPLSPVPAALTSMAAPQPPAAGAVLQPPARPLRGRGRAQAQGWPAGVVPLTGCSRPY